MLKVNPELPDAVTEILPLVPPTVVGLLEVPLTEIVTPLHGLGGGLVPPLPPLLQAYTTKTTETRTIHSERKDIDPIDCWFLLLTKLNQYWLPLLTTNKNYLGFLLLKGSNPTVKRTPPLLSFTLPKPTPVNGSLIYGSAVIEMWFPNLR